MIEALRKIWRFSGTERSNINKSVLFCFINAVLRMTEIGAIYMVVLALLEKKTGDYISWLTLALVVISIIGTAVTKNFSQLEQTHAGYYMAANKRIDIANRMKSVPMGYFNENSLGELTGVSTTVLENIETIAPMVLVGILSGLINALVFTLMVLCWDWRIGAIVVIGTALYLLVTSRMEEKSVHIAPHRQKSEAVLVGAVIEYVQGMSVIKSFNLARKGDKTVQDALEYNRKSNLNMERLFTPYVIAQGILLQAFSVGMMLAATLFYINGTMSTADALMTVIMSFLVFAQIQSAGSGLSLLRLVSSSIDHTERLDSIPQLDENGKNLRPLDHTISLEHVSFSYDHKEILHDVSLTIPDKTTTAIIGPSGSGKTTLTSLIARFWDVDSGCVKIGGQDIKKYTLESLMDQISMVFQNVYLFADTIENNIKFGKPDASHEEVVAAAKKACCQAFIERMPEGYQTVIGEGGASLSGGEKQRISIARAMLKNAPIVIFDEATANIDPENEDLLQKAIEALTHDKTIIMIAHRLKTVRHADQILVVDDGRIVQRGRHEELITQHGIYASFVQERQVAASWKIT
ncbi:MAG: ABC transporter ATP-binding protein [Anaerostipes sp.]|nr:ABC transporter ATP-binding protein [Anaerostipes sp.]